VKIWDGGGNMLNFENAIAEILNHTRRREHSLSAICFADGDRAAGLRMKYIDGNAFFGVVENSLFNISITDEEFAASEDERHYFLYLGGENTWIYKPLNFIYNLRGGKFYINCEHTYQDAGTVVEICGRAFANMRKKIEKNRDAQALIIDEYFDDAYAVEASKIKSEYEAKIKKFFCKNLFLEIGDEKLARRSKDSVMQFLLQYAQLRTFGKIRGMYEAVDVRDYQYGRTECVRPVSRESVDFVKSLAAGDAKEKISEKFLLAEKEHKNRIKACKKAEGIDRHLFGLYMASKRLTGDDERSAAEEFFSDASYKKVTENFLSTTSVGYQEHAGYILFTPVAEKGMGVTYLKEPDGIRYLISYYVSETEKVSEFAAALAEGLEKIKAAL
jgi:carnitine O-acetyltransferase